MAVVEELVRGADGYIRAAQIRYDEGRKKNRPIAKLYPLEVTSSSNNDVTKTENSTTTTATSDVPASIPSRESRPTRSSATKAQQNIAEWSRELLLPAPEDVMD